MIRLTALSACLLAILAVGCGQSPSPTAPSSVATSLAATIALEAEAGSGDGDLFHRSRASGALTVHLAPGQRRQWTFKVPAQPSNYAIFVTYSNDNPGDTEVLRVEVDGEQIGALPAQDTGDDGEGWNVFVADPAGTLMLRPGTHSVTVQSTGGDGCIEIDMIALRPGAQ